MGYHLGCQARGPCRCHRKARMIPAVWDQLRRLRCTTFHWHRKRDSYGNRCPKCDIYW